MMIAVRNWLYTCFIELRRHVVDVVMSSGSLPDYFGRQLADTNCRPGNRMNHCLSPPSLFTTHSTTQSIVWPTVYTCELLHITVTFV